MFLCGTHNKKWLSRHFSVLPTNAGDFKTVVAPTVSSLLPMMKTLTKVSRFYEIWSWTKRSLAVSYAHSLHCPYLWRVRIRAQLRHTSDTCRVRRIASVARIRSQKCLIHYHLLTTHRVQAALIPKRITRHLFLLCSGARLHWTNFRIQRTDIPFQKRSQACNMLNPPHGFLS